MAGHGVRNDCGSEKFISVVHYRLMYMISIECGNEILYVVVMLSYQFLFCLLQKALTNRFS